MSAARWLWTGGPAEPTADMAQWLEEMGLRWWVEPALFDLQGWVLAVVRAGSKDEPTRVLPGSTLVHDGRQLQMLAPGGAVEDLEMYAKQRRVVRIARDLEAFLNEPPQLQRAVLLWVKQNRPDTYRRLHEFLNPEPPVPTDERKEDR